jgi:hypothetical protein
MAAELTDGSFRLGESTSFTIFDPKERLITAPCFRERVAHHAIMNVCEPVFDRSLVADTFACRPGKGSLAAIERAAEFARHDAFYLKIDIRKYFDSIDHNRLLERLGRLFKDRRLLELFDRIIRSHADSRGVGVPIGSLTSQHFANCYLGPVDRLVKERMKVRGYVRYMDDALIWGGSARELQRVLLGIETLLAEQLGLQLKPSFINRVRHGVDFLGFRIFPGRIAMSRRGRARFRRKLYHLESSHERGEIDEPELQARVTALVASTAAAGESGWRWRRRVIEMRSVSGQRPRLG